MKKILPAFLAVLILLTGILAAFPAMAAGPGTYFVACSNGGDLNLREKADIGSASLAKIPYGTQLQITEVSADNAWGQTSFNGKAGWVMMSYLSSASPDPSKSKAEKAKADMESINAEFNTMNKNLGKPSFEVVVRTNKTTTLYHLRWAPCINTTALRNDVMNGEVFTVIAEGRSWYQVVDNVTGRIAYIAKSICQIK